MKINLDRYLNQELNLLANLILKNDDWKRIDEMAFERKFGEKNVVLVIYPELLRYGYVYRQGRSGDKTTHEDQAVVWLTCRIELEGTDTDKHYEILEELKEWVENNLPLKPFHDEDATLGMFGKGCSPYSRDWTEYKFYVNPDYPNGWWENHTL